MQPIATIIMPAYNEERYIGPAIASLVGQMHGLPVEFIVADSGSTDRTAEVASRYPVEVIVVGRGKLTARRQAMQRARGPIIVAVDADSFYPHGWLARILSHFGKRGVVGVSGCTEYIEAPWANIGPTVTAMQQWFVPRMRGQCSAYLLEAYYRVGGFRDIDQMDREAMIEEEEFEFARRLAIVGKVVFDDMLICYTSARHFLHSDLDYEQERASGQRF